MRRFLTSADSNLADDPIEADEEDEDEEDDEDLELNEEPDFVDMIFNSLLMIAILVGLLVILILLSACCCLWSKGRACVKKLWRKVFWNMILRSQLETSLELFIGCFTQFCVLSFSTSEESFASGVSIGSFTLMIFLAICIPFYLRCKSSRLADPEFNGSCGSLILRMNPKKIGILCF